MAFEKINVKPEQKLDLIALAEKEGRHIYKMLEILIENYKKTKEDNADG